MSIVCLSYVMRNSEAQLGARLVLFVLAEHAHDDGSESYPTVETLMERTRMSRRSVQAALRRLEADGAIREYGVGPRGQHKYRVVMGGADSAPAQNLRSEVDDVEGRSSRQVGGADSAPEPSFNRPEPSDMTEEGAREAGIPDEMRQDAEDLLRRKIKVNGLRVTEGEAMIAAAALAEFNRIMESDFGLGAQITRMVMRIRERPSWDAAKHVRLVRSACRIRWWEKQGGGKRATPQVIWGNERCFERVAQDAADEAASRELLAGNNGHGHANGNGNGNGNGVVRSVDGNGFPVTHDRHGNRLYFGLRPWRELSAAERLSAHELIGMGEDPATR